MKYATFKIFGPRNGHSSPHPHKKLRACQSTHVVQMEYCCEPWVKSPDRAHGASSDRRKGSLLHRVTELIT